MLCRNDSSFGRVGKFVSGVYLAAHLLVLSVAATDAAVLNISGSFEGGQLGPVSFDITIDADFSSEIFDTTSGLTINSLSLVPAGGLAYAYRPSSDRLVLGGLENNVRGLSPATTDFYLSIDDLFTSPFIEEFADTREDLSGVYFQDEDLDENTSLSVTAATVIPLPAGLPLLGAGLVAFGLLKRRRRASSRG